MFVLAAKFTEEGEVKYFVAPSKMVLKALIEDAVDYRLWNGGWIESKNDKSWRTIGSDVQGASAQIMFY